MVSRLRTASDPLDILERLADLIRPLLAWRQQPGGTNQPPKGSTRRRRLHGHA